MLRLRQTARARSVGRDRCRAMTDQSNKPHFKVTSLQVRRCSGHVC